MNFQSVAQQFEQGESGTDSFKLMYRNLQKLMQADPANAAAYFIIGSAAHNYVLRYEDQAVDPEVADAAQSTLVDYCDRLLRVWDSVEQDKYLALSWVANHYEWNVTNY